MEIDGRIHILIRADLGRILGTDLFLVAGGAGDHLGDLLAAVLGVAGAQVQVDEVLMDEREAPVDI